MHQRRLDRASMGFGGVLKAVLMGGGLGKTQPPFAPQDARQFLDQVLLGRPLRTMFVRQG